MTEGHRRTAQVGKGLFLVRYVQATDLGNPPLVTVSAENDSQSHVHLVLHPDHSEPVLTQPGACLVVRATKPGSLAIAVEPRQPNGSLAATVNIEPLGEADGAPDDAQAREKATLGDADDLKIMAHIAGRGDVYANINEWLAGPAAPSRIEGISIQWPTKPQGLNVSYSVRTAQPLSISGQFVDVGSFAGTRGRAMALTGVVFELSGPDADHYQLEVEALFLGSPLQRAVGQRVVLSGPTGREPLVGVRLALAALTKQPEQRDRPDGKGRAFPHSELDQRTLGTASDHLRGSGRVRVFRGRPKKEQPTA
jgi:hypothetical protein